MLRRIVLVTLAYIAMTVVPGTVILLLSVPFPFLATLFEPAPEWLLALSNLAFFGLWYAVATGKLRRSRDR